MGEGGRRPDEDSHNVSFLLALNLPTWNEITMKLFKDVLIAIIGMTCAVSLTGCYSTSNITHDNANFAKTSPPDAMIVLTGRSGRLPMSDTFFYIKAVDETGFEYGHTICTNSTVKNGKNIVGFVVGGAVGVLAMNDEEKKTYTIDPKLRNAPNYGYQYLGRAKFADISSIKQLKFHSNDNCIRLFFDNEKYEYLDILCDKDQAVTDNSVLSALLALCPNVK
jgi:hypothetical protein